MAKQLIKISGQFTALGDRVALAVPERAAEASLRLYTPHFFSPNEAANHEVAIFAIVDGPVDPAETVVVRTFQLIAGAALPDNFVKYVGSLLFGADRVEAHVVEVAG